MSQAAKPPKPWRYLLWSTLALIILIPLWVYALWWMQPEFLTNPETSMMQRTLGWLGLPIAAVVLMGTGMWMNASAQARQAEAAKPATTQSEAPAPKVDPAEQARREYVLEIIGMGVTLDKYRQGKLWEALQQGHPFGSIREQDPKKYPWARDDKYAQEGGRSASTLENGIGRLPMYWPAPSFYADGPAQDSNEPVSETNPSEGLVGATDSNGLSWTLFVSAGWSLSEHPDRLLETAFDFFDQHPDAPYLVVAAADGLYFRDLYRPKGTEQLIKDGYYVPSMPDSSALFVLARRERVEALRPFAFEDTSEDELGPEQNRKGIARRLFLAHSALSKRVPMPKGALFRNPTVPEWLAESAKLAQREEFQAGKGTTFFADRLGAFGGGVVHVPSGFKPTPWFPVPWNKKQLSDFDALPTLGYLHRPVFIKLTDKDGHVIQRRDERAKALLQGWQQALLTLPEDQRKTALKRIVVSTGGDTNKMVALTTLMNAQAEAGGPELDATKSSQWVNSDARLGNTGAATWFVDMAIGVLASHIDGGVSAAINLRDDKEASVIFVSPPPEDKRQKQNRAKVLKNNTTPAIDPANYQPQ
ncbi:MAG: DUF2875 family protein [Aquabacterium sp.]